MRPPEPFSDAQARERRGLARGRVGLIAAAFLAPFSATHLIGSLTVGRLMVVLFAVLLGVDLIRERPRSFRPDLPTAMLVVGYLGLCGWVLVSSQTTGCNCEGKAGGLFELSAIGLLAIVAIGFEPRLRDAALLASLAGLTLAAGLALVGVGSINSATVDLTDTGGRLSGTYGNANELGLAAALGVPVSLAYFSVAGPRMRLTLATSCGVLVAALALTYSRGGIIAAAAGVLALALWSARGSRRSIVLTLGVAAIVAASGAGLYSVFKAGREGASFAAVAPRLGALDQRDTSGWDARALGPIPAGPSVLANRADGILVRSSGGEGVSFRWGEAHAGATYLLRFEARAARDGTRIEYGLGDRLAKRGVHRSAILGRHWQQLFLRWQPHLDAPHASFFLWLPARMAASFVVVSPRVIESKGTAVLGAAVAPARLRGSVYAHLSSDGPQLEHRYIESRLDAARLALRAFGSAPILGIGWSTFPAYSAERADYGRLAAHDQYLLVSAELGLVGLVFLGLLLAAPIVASRGAPPDHRTAAAIGLLTTAAAGMFFVEPLSSPQISVPVALAAAVLCAGLGPPTQTERTRSVTSEPPLSDAS